MSVHIRLSFCCALIFLLASAVSAATRTVGSGGTCTHSTIGDAVAAADPGDVIVVADGVWSQGPLFIFKDLEIRSGIDQSCTSLTIGPVVLDSATGSRLFTILAGEVTLRGLTLKGVDLTAAAGGGIYASGDGTRVEVIDVLFDRNEALSGGGVFVTNLAVVSLTDAEFLANKARQAESPGGGAIHCSGAQVEVLATVFNSNSTTGVGGAVFSEDCAVTLDGSTERNTYVFYDSALSGGGIYADSSTVNLGMEYLPTGNLAEQPSFGVRFAQNAASNAGGGLAAVNGTTVNIGHTTFDGNDADINGGAIYLDNSSIYSSPCRNRQPCVELSYDAAPFGSGIYATNSVLSLSRMVVSRSAWSAPAVAGTFLWSSASDVRITNSVYRGGNQDQDVGTVIDDRNSTRFVLASMTFHESSAAEALINFSGTSDAAVLRSLFWDNGSPIYDGSNVSPLYGSLFECNLVQSLVSLPGDHIDSHVGDPLFTSVFGDRDEYERDVYTVVAPTSPAIDLCVGNQNGLTLDQADLTGYPRGTDPGRDAGAQEMRWLFMDRWDGTDLSQWSAAVP